MTRPCASHGYALFLEPGCWFSRACAGAGAIVVALLCLLGGRGSAWAQQAADVEEESTVAGKPWYQGTTLEQRKKARELLLEGNKHIDELSFGDAVKKYQAAIEIWDNPVFHYNLAIAQINLMQPTAAYESLQKALQYGAAPFDEDRYKRALEYKKSLESQLARVHITCSQPGAEVSLDGRVIFVGPGTYQGVVQPGAHQLVASKQGYLTESRQLVGTPGEETRVEIRMRTPERVLTVRRWAAWKPWVVVAGGSLALLGAGVMDRQSSRGFDEYDDEFVALCGDAGCRQNEIPSELQSRLSGARTQQWIARVSYGVAGASLAVGAVLLYVNREKIVKVTEGSDDAAQVSLMPVFSRDSLGLQAGFRF